MRIMLNTSKGMLILILLLMYSVLFSQDQDTTAWSVEIEDIVVTAQFAPTHSKNALHKVRSINVANIQNRGINDLEKLLEHELNIRISQDMILGSSINLQGLSGQNVKVMIDGVPVIGRVGDNIDISQISLFNVDRIEIIEGPMSVNYGTNALGGVINIISKKSQLKKYDLNLNTSILSTSDKNLNLSAGFRLSENVLLRLEGNYFKFDGYNSQDSLPEIFERTFQWNPKTKRNLSGLLRYNFGEDGNVSYRASFFDEEVENAGILRRPNFKPYAFDEFYLTDRVDHALFMESTVGKNYYLKSTLANNFFKRQKDVVRIDFDDDLLTELPAQEDTSIFKSWVFRPVIASKYSKSRINFQLGAELSYEEGFGKKIFDADIDETGYSYIGDYALFSSLRYKPIDKLELQSGLRVSKNTKFKSPLIPSFNFKYNFPGDLILRGSYARGFRAPSLKELYLYFVDSNHYIVGNPELQPEISDNFQLAAEFGVLKDPVELIMNLTGFYNDIRDKIDLYDFIEVDGKYVPAAEQGKSTTDFTYFNQDQFKSLGLNAGIDLKYGHFKSSFGVAPIGRYNSLPDQVVDIKPFSYVVESNASFSYNIPSIELSFHFYIKHNNKLIRYYVDVDEAGNTFTNQTEYDGYYLADFNLVKKFLNNRIKMNLGIKNIFDVSNINFSDIDAANSGNISEGEFPVAKGRQLHAGLLFHFSAQ